MDQLELALNDYGLDQVWQLRVIFQSTYVNLYMLACLAFANHLCGRFLSKLSSSLSSRPLKGALGFTELEQQRGSTWLFYVLKAAKAWQQHLRKLKTPFETSICTRLQPILDSRLHVLRHTWRRMHPTTCARLCGRACAMGRSTSWKTYLTWHGHPGLTVLLELFQAVKCALKKAFT